MTTQHTSTERSSIRRNYAIRASVGGVLGTALGLLGGAKAQSETGIPPSTAELLTLLLTSAAGGAITGVVLWRFRNIRKRGRWGHYVAWIIALTVATITLLAPSAWQERDWRPLGLAIFLGISGGLGLAMFSRHFEENAD